MADTIALVKFWVRRSGADKSKKSRQRGNGPKISSLIERKGDAVSNDEREYVPQTEMREREFAHPVKLYINAGRLSRNVRSKNR